MFDIRAAMTSSLSIKLLVQGINHFTQHVGLNGVIEDMAKIKLVIYLVVMSETSFCICSTQTSLQHLCSDRVILVTNLDLNQCKTELLFILFI